MRSESCDPSPNMYYESRTCDLSDGVFLQKATLATEEVMGRLKKQMDELAAQIEKTGNQ